MSTASSDNSKVISFWYRTSTTKEHFPSVLFSIIFDYVYIGLSFGSYWIEHKTSGSIKIKKYNALQFQILNFSSIIPNDFYIYSKETIVETNNKFMNNNNISINVINLSNPTRCSFGISSANNIYVNSRIYYYKTNFVYIKKSDIFKINLKINKYKLHIFKNKKLVHNGFIKRNYKYYYYIRVNTFGENSMVQLKVSTIV